MGIRALAAGGWLVLLLAPSAAAQQPEAPSGSRSDASSNAPTILEPDQAIDFSVQPPEGKAPADLGASPEARGEPPPPRPRRTGLVLATTLGVLGFAGQFRHVATAAYWLHAQLGYEFLKWLMVFGSAEVGLTDTSVSLDPSESMAFALWGFDAGARATIHAGDRVAFYLQGELGELAADVPHDSLGVLGFPNAESLNLAAGGRFGIEWYQTDRHMALYVAGGGRYAEGFAKVIGGGDVPVLWDAGAGIRYTF